MSKTKYLFLVALFFFTNCAKEQLEVEVPVNTPLFKVSLINNNQPLVIEAGKDGFYLYTDASVSSDGELFGPISEFAKLDPCLDNCSESFSVTINNIPTSEVNAFFNESDFNPEKINLLTDPNETGAVIIRYVDQNEVEYLSTLGTQETDSHFTISEIEPYINNEKGQQTKLAHASLKCQLYSDSGVVLNMESIEVVIAIALPE